MNIYPHHNVYIYMPLCPGCGGDAAVASRHHRPPLDRLWQEDERTRGGRRNGQPQSTTTVFYLSIALSIYPFIDLSIALSDYLSIHLSIYLSHYRFMDPLPPPLTLSFSLSLPLSLSPSLSLSHPRSLSHKHTDKPQHLSQVLEGKLERIDEDV